MDRGGVVDALQSIVRFGMVIYSGGESANCVQLVTVDPALNNLATLSAVHPMQPLGMGTPTDKALDYVVNNLPVLNTGRLDMPGVRGPRNRRLAQRYVRRRWPVSGKVFSPN